MIETCKLSPTLTISRVLTGLWQIADLERDGTLLDPGKTADFMQAYFDGGLTTFDMADHYGSSEIIAGHFRKRRHVGDRVQLLTKWVPKPGKLSRKEIRAAIELALRRLDVETIDLMQYHAWNYADPVWLDQLFYLQELKSEGLIGNIGLTNFDTAHLRIALHSGIEVVSNQVCYSLLDQRAASAMTELCLRHDVKLLAFGTVAGGFLTEKWLDKPEPEQLQTWSQMKYKRFIDVAGGWEPYQHVLRAVKEVADRHGVSMANVVCRYMLQQPAVGGVIIGARLGRSEHVADNLRLFSFELDPRSQDEIRAAISALNPVPGDCGDEYRKPPFLTASGDLSHHLEKMPLPYQARDIEGGRQQVLSGTEWETIGGFCRAMRIGKRILLSGTTATHGNRAIGGADIAAQTHFAIDKIEGAIQSLGGKLSDVVRTRIYVRDIADWEIAARVHGERFAGILPVNTLVQATLVGDDYLVEIEAEAIVDQAGSTTSPGL